MGRNYSRKDVPAASDLPLIWDSANSDWRLTPVSGLAKTVATQLSDLQSAVQKATSQYLSPATGFSVTLEGEENLHLIMTPSTTLSTGSINLPKSPGTKDKQLVVVTSSQEVTSLTVSGNGADVVGSPSTLAVGGYFTMKYDMQTNTWYRVA